MRRDDHAAFRALLGHQFTQQLQSQPIGQAHVGDDRIEALALKLLARLQQIAGRFHPITFAEQRQLVQGAQIRLIVDDKNMGWCGGGGLHA